MKITIKEIKYKIKLANDSKHPDLLAYVSISFIEEHERFFIVNGFTIRKSRFNGKPYLAAPSKRTVNGFYKFTLIERSLWREIEKEIISEYDAEIIPIVEEK